MNNMMNFLIQMFLIMLLMNMGLGLTFCMMAGSISHIVPLMGFGVLVMMIYGLAIALFA